MTLAEFKKANHEKNIVAWVATKHHVTHKGDYLDFKNHFYQSAIYNDNSEYMVIIKSTQNGMTEYLLVRSIAHAMNGMRVFYVLPTFELVKRYVDERYTKTTQNTPFYRNLVRAVKEEMDVKQTESVKSKDIGQGNIAFINSFSPIGFTEYPADEVIIDELDRCDQANIEMAWERLSHSDYRWQVKISNPTYRNFGIDTEYNETDKMEYHIECESGHLIRLNWFKHIVKEIEDGKYMIRDEKWTWNSNRDIYPICDKCGKPIDRRKKGLWIPTGTGIKRGYRLTKLFTGTVTIAEIMDRFIKGLKDDEVMQRFYNADLGEAFTASGATITREMIEACRHDYLNPNPEDGIILAGVDVGKNYHFVIKQMLPDKTLKTLYIGKVTHTQELVSILKEYKVNVGIIDALPETRESRKIANYFKMFFMCYFGGNKSDKIDFKNKIVTVQRTPAIDAVKEALLTKAIQYPNNIMSNGEFVENMTSSVRVFNADKKQSGATGAYEWVEGNKPDHYLLATAYCLIARRLIVLLNK